MAKKHEAFESNGLNGPGKAWGVRQGGVVYEAMFCEATAKRLAVLCDEMPSGDWDAHSQCLQREGFSLEDPCAPTRARRG